MRLRAHRTVSISFKPGPFCEAVSSMGLAAKNLRNIGVFLVKNVLSSFDSEGKLRPLAELHANQIEALEAANAAAKACDATRGPKNDAKAKELLSLQAKLAAGLIGQAELDSEAPKLKSCKLFPDFLGPDANPWAVLDDRLLDKMMRTRTDAGGARPFEALPAKASEQVRMQVSSELKSWLASLKAYRSHPERFQALPRMPGYLPKNARIPVKLFAGSIGAKRLPPISGRDLRAEFEGPKLPGAAFEAYARLDWAEVKAKLHRQVDRPGSKLVEIRLVPGRSGSAKVEGVFECQLDIPDASLLAKASKKALDAGVKAADRAGFCAKIVAALPDGEMPKSAGLDVGLNNLATISLSTGRPSIVVSNARVERRTRLLDAKIDARISELALAAPPAIQALLAKRQALAVSGAEAELCEGERPDPAATLSPTEMGLLRAFDQGLHADAKIQRLRGERESWLREAMHQASSGIVEALRAEGVEFLAIGRNLLWKSGSDLGAKGNRRLRATPHSTLVEMLAYKCEDAGILALRQEESYTSQASFGLGEPIATYGEQPKQDKPAEAPATKAKTEKRQTKGRAEKRQETHPTIPSPTREANPGDIRPAYAKGRRSAPKGAKASSKHQFRLPPTALPDLAGRGLGPAWMALHADANAAANILRKAMPAFRAHAGLSPRFELWWLSPRGLRPFKARPKVPARV